MYAISCRSVNHGRLGRDAAVRTTRANRVAGTASATITP